MNRILRIALLVLVILPIWITIVALAETPAALTGWKEQINSKLLTVKERRIQMTELLARGADLDSSLLQTSFEIDLSGVRDQGISELVLKFYDQDGRLSHLSRVHAKLFIQDEVAVAAKTFSSGETIGEGDLRMEWRDASTLKGPIMHPRDLLGKTLRSPVRENEVIYETRIQRDQLVSRGDRVKISVIAGSIRVSGLGIAQEAGAKGQTIKVLNGDSRKEVYGVITDAKAVEVRL